MENNISSCHPNRFAHCKGLCKSCYDKWLKSVNPEYKKRQSDNTTAWMKRNPESRQKHRERQKERERLNPLIRRNYLLRSKYGITEDIFQAMLTKQNGACAICHRKSGKTPLHVDHNHSTRKVRGLLCHQCNWYLGVIERGTRVLERLQAYVLTDGVHDFRQG